jgi:hypothetical protein
MLSRGHSIPLVRNPYRNTGLQALPGLISQFSVKIGNVVTQLLLVSGKAVTLFEAAEPPPPRSQSQTIVAFKFDRCVKAFNKLLTGAQKVHRRVQLTKYDL